jgi:hypothetical protein
MPLFDTKQEGVQKHLTMLVCHFSNWHFVNQLVDIVLWLDTFGQSSG